MVLPAMMTPRLSLQNSALSAASVMVECVTSPSHLQRDAVAAGAEDFAIGDADGLHRVELRERAAGRQLAAAAVEREAGERNTVRMARPTISEGPCV